MIAASAMLVVSSCGVDFTGLFEGADAATDGPQLSDVDHQDTAADAPLDRKDASPDSINPDVVEIDAVDAGAPLDVAVDRSGGDVNVRDATTEVADVRGGSDPVDVSSQDTAFDRVIDVETDAGVDGKLDAVSDAEDAGRDVARDTSSDGADAGPPGTCSGSCNTIDDIGQTVTRTVQAGPPPAMTGGTIVDGTYVATAIVQYNNDMTPYTLSETSIISGTVDAWVSSINGAAATRATTTISTMNNQMVLAFCCPNQNSVTITYSTDGVTLVHVDPLNNNRVITYTRQ